MSYENNVNNDRIISMLDGATKLVNLRRADKTTKHSWRYS